MRGIIMTSKRYISSTCTRGLTSLSTVLCAVALALPASASPLLEHTGGQMGSGGFNARFTESGTAAAYFNPAMLTRADNGLSVGAFVLSDQIRVRLNSREGLGVDVPQYPDRLRFSNGEETLPFDRMTFPTSELYGGCTIEDNPCAARPRQQDGSSGNTRAYALVGLVNRIIDEHLVVGLYAMLPLGQYTTARSFFVDEREQFFSNSLHPELYSDRLTAPSLSFAIGSELIDGLSLGVAFTIALLNDADAGVYVPDAGNQRDTLQLTTDVGVAAKVAPHLGLTYSPIDALSISATAHSPSRFEINTGFANLLPNGDEQIATRTTVHDYMPWIIGLGADYAFDVGRYDMSVVAGVTYTLYSNYINRVNERPTGDYAWSNIVSPSVGLRMDEGRWRLMGDFAYLPSPVPEQTGRTNYVDNDRLTGMIGGEYDFDVAGLRMSVGASLQGHLFLQRSHTKIEPRSEGVVSNPLDPDYDPSVNAGLVRDEMPDSIEDSLRPGEPWAPAAGLQTNNPGYPGYSSDGFMWGAGIHLSIYY